MKPGSSRSGKTRGSGVRLWSTGNPGLCSSLVTSGWLLWVGLTCPNLKAAFSVSSLPRASCWLSLLFLLASHPDCCSQLEEEESTQTTPDASSLPFQPTSSQARASSSCYCFPREPGSCLFWHAVRELVALHHAKPTGLTNAVTS